MNETQVAREQVTKAVFYALYEAWKSPENVTPEDLALTRSKFGLNRENVTFTQWMAALKAYQNGETYNGIGVSLEDIRVRIFAYDYSVNDQQYFYFDPTDSVRIVWTDNWFQLAKYGSGNTIYGLGTFHRPDGSLGMVFNIPDDYPRRDDVFAEILIQVIKRLSASSKLQSIDSKTHTDTMPLMTKAKAPLEMYACYNLSNNTIFCGIAPASEKGR